MKKLFISMLFVFLIACDDDRPSKVYLLTKGSSEGWFITAVNTVMNTECGPEGAMMQDNTWTFYSDGKFTFDHGAVYDAGDCDDMKNLTGTWKFEEDETIITIFASFNTDDPDDIINDEIVSAQVIELTENKMILDQDGAHATFTPR